MIARLLSNDLPRSRWLAAALVLVVLALFLAPFLFPGAKALSVAAKALVFILLVASFDLLLGDASVEKYRIVAVLVGSTVFAAMVWTLNRTKVGLLIRAGVQDREMVESLGYRIKRLFVGVFVAGSALAGLGGVMWGLYQQNVVPQMGAQVNVLIFIVIIIGGLGSTLGALIGALLVGLMANYTGFLVPKVALFSNIALMVAILLWRPQGVYPVTSR